MPATLRRGDEGLELNLQGHQDFHGALAAAKAVPGRRFDGNRKLWIYPSDPAIAERLMVTVGMECDAALISWVKKAKAERQGELLTPLPDDATLLVPWADKLFDFQRSLVDFACDGGTEAGKTRLIIADDMGLGKTAEGISVVEEAYLRHGYENGPRLVIAPSSVKGGWRREIAKWVGSGEPYVVVDAKTHPKRRAQIVEGIKNDAWVIVNWEQIRLKTEVLKVKGKDKDVLVMREPLFQMPHLHDVIADMSPYELFTANQKVKVQRRDGLIKGKQWLACLADEAHRAKNTKASQTKGMFRIDAVIKLALTGTPVMNSPDEIYSLLMWLWPQEYTSYHQFYDAYVEHYEGQYGKVVIGVKNPDQLRFALSKRLKRRTKGQVLSLPQKTRTFQPVTLSAAQRKLYKAAETDMWLEVEQAIKDGDKAAARFADAVARNPSEVFSLPNGAARTTRLRQIASTPATLGGDDVSAKLDAAVDRVIDSRPAQWVVFVEFKETASCLKRRLELYSIDGRKPPKGSNHEPLRVAVYTGDVGTEDRTQIEESFQRGEIDVIVGTIGAMKEGITLHAASDMLFVDRPWVPAVADQCEDREHRIGQHHPVNIVVLEAEDTVDTAKIAPTLAIKRLIVGQVIDQDEVQEIR